MASAADGIGRYLLNEDGTIRDFTNYELMKGMHEMLKKGIVDMRRSTVAIQKKIEETPTEMTAHFDKEDMTRLENAQILQMGAGFPMGLYRLCSLHDGFIHRQVLFTR